MALLLPVSTDMLNSPQHSFLHRVVAIDSAANECTIQVAASGLVCIRNIVQVGTPLATAGEMDLYNATNTYKSGFKGGIPYGAADLLWTLPADIGSAGQFIITDGAGNLVWCTHGSVCVNCYVSCTICVVCCACGDCGSFVCYVDFGGQSYSTANAVYCVNTSWTYALLDCGGVCVWC